MEVTSLRTAMKMELLIYSVVVLDQRRSEDPQRVILQQLRALLDNTGPVALKEGLMISLINKLVTDPP